MEVMVVVVDAKLYRNVAVDYLAANHCYVIAIRKYQHHHHSTACFAYVKADLRRQFTIILSLSLSHTKYIFLKYKKQGLSSLARLHKDFFYTWVKLFF